VTAAIRFSASREYSKSDKEHTVTYIEIAQVGEIPAGAMKGLSAGGKDILVANVGGQYYAIGGKCTHMHGDLSRGTLAGKVVTCPRHGSQFDVTTGSRLAGPAKSNEPAYEVKVEGKNIKVGI
jgi:nitrite reductase/ring-hydroxylating ferredoxin subunit